MRCLVMMAYWAHARRCALGQRQTGLDTPGSMGPTISKEQGRELLTDIHGRDYGHHSSSRTLAGKVFHRGFY